MYGESQVYGATRIQINRLWCMHDSQHDTFTPRTAQDDPWSLRESQQRADLTFLAAVGTLRGFGSHFNAEDFMQHASRGIGIQHQFTVNIYYLFHLSLLLDQIFQCGFGSSRFRS